MSKSPWIAVIGLVLIASSSLASANNTPQQTAVWTPQKLRFAYNGFTTKFSCRGLSRVLHAVVLELGARKEGLKLDEYNCGIDPTEPARFPGVKLQFSSLQPTAAGAANAVSAHWSKAKLSSSGHGDHPVELRQGDCELVEQIKRQLLPLFTTRNVVGGHSCVPNQVNAGSPGLRLEVLSVDTGIAQR